MAVEITGYPSTTNFSIATPDTLESSEVVQYVLVDALDFVGDEYIEVVYNSQTITIYLQEECRYTPTDIHFINKEGAQQTLTFFKAKEDRIKTDKETYESDRGQPSLGNHQYVDFNVTGRLSFKVVSGYVDEEMNDTFKQLLLSSQVWLIGTSQEYIPLNVGTSSLTYKTRQKDRLISYEIEFDAAYNEINNV